MKHRLIRGFRITSPLPQVPSDLQVQIEWRDDSEQVQMISDWVLHESTTYWRQIQPLLYSSSAGRLRWDYVESRCKAWRNELPAASAYEP